MKELAHDRTSEGLGVDVWTPSRRARVTADRHRQIFRRWSRDIRNQYLENVVMALSVCVLVLGGLALRAEAQSPLIAELRAIAGRYHERPSDLFRIRDGLEAALTRDEHIDNLTALAWVCFIIGDLPSSTKQGKLDAYDRGRRAAARAIELDPKSVGGHFWVATNTARWGQTNGVLRSLFLLPTVERHLQAVLDLDPAFTPAYSLAGNIYAEVPGLLGGDLNRAEAMFRKGLQQNAKFTGMRVGLAKTLIKQKRVAEARRELEAVLTERAPWNLADWTVKDAPEARHILDSIQRTSERERIPAPRDAPRA